MANALDKATASMVENLKLKTGKSLEEWTKIALSAKLAKHGEIVKFLKEQHGWTHGYANLVAHTVLKSGGTAEAPAGDALVDAQYAGTKAALRPIYDALVAKVKAFGADVELAPKKTYVSVRRSKQFALFQPSTATRFDVGINLKDEPAADRLEASGSFSAMVTHRVRLSSVKDVDKALLAWLKKAYDAS